METIQTQENNLQETQPIEQPKQVGIDDFLKDFQAPKEPFNQVIKDTLPISEEKLPGVDGLTTPGNSSEQQPKIDIAPPPSNDRKTHLEAKMIVSIFDGGIGKACQYLAQAESSKKYRAEPEEKDDLTLLLAEYLKESGGKVPVWILLLILAGSIYGPNIYLAYQEGRDKNKPKPKQTNEPKNNEQIIYAEAKQTEQNTGFTFDPVKTDIVEVKVRSCANCGKDLKPNQKLYCGNICKNRANGKITGNKKRGKKKVKPSNNLNTYEVLPG